MHAGPGAGKTLGALLSFKAMKKEGLLKSFVVFCHRNSIASQWQKASEKLALKVQEIGTYPNQQEISTESDGWILTYQGATKQLQNSQEILRIFSQKKLLAIADEAHHLGVNPDEQEEAIWGRTFSTLTDKSVLRLGLTGTPFRADNLAFCSARKVQVHTSGGLVEQINPDLCVEPRELISAGDVRPLEFHFQDGWVEHSHEGQPDRETSPLSTEQRESWRARNLRRATHLSNSNSIAVQLIHKARRKLTKIRYNHKDAAGLVIARDIEHAKEIANLLNENGDSAVLVHSQDKEASDRLNTFKEGKSNWLVSVDMCSEGFDAPRIRVVVYLTTVVTKSRFLQGITRSVRMSPERELLEPIPRNPSHVFAPADPLLMEYARSWSESKPYLIKGTQSVSEIGNLSWIPRAPILPMDTVGDGAGEVINMRSAQLPQFLKR